MKRDYYAEVQQPPVPKAIQILMIFTLTASVALVILNRFVPAIMPFILLSYPGLKSYYLWTVVTSAFVETPNFHLGFIISLLFYALILWRFGGMLLDRYGSKPFLKFYFTVAICAQLSLSVMLLLYPASGNLASPWPAVLGILTVWTMIYAEELVAPFGLFFVKAKWLFLFIVGIEFLGALAQPGASYLACAKLSGILVAYFYGLIVWKLTGPFSFSHGFDRWLGNLFTPRVKRVEAPVWEANKIYDIKTGEAVVSDDEFIDQMLEKISKKGETSLSAKEKKRMQEISMRRKLRDL